MGGTVVLMMAVENAPAIAKALIAGGRAEATPVAVICDGTMPGERTVLATLGTLGAELEAEQVKPPAIIVVGGVVAVAHPELAGERPGRPRLMATLHEISDPADPRLADYRDLRDVELRKHLEAEHGLFLAEGEKVVRRAVEAGFAPRSFLMAPRWLDGLADVLDRSDAPCFVVSEALAEEVTGFHVHRGALASLQRRPLPAVESVLAGARSVLVLEDIVDHTNVGAILRSGAALGFDAVLLAPRCADPLYRRSIKVAMGAVFTMPWTRLPDWYDALPSLSAQGLHDRGAHLARRRRDPDRGRGRRARQGRARARLGGARPLVALGGVVRPARDHPDARGHRLAERRRGHRRGVLRHLAALTRAQRRSRRQVALPDRQ